MFGLFIVLLNGIKRIRQMFGRAETLLNEM